MLIYLVYSQYIAIYTIVYTHKPLYCPGKTYLPYTSVLYVYPTSKYIAFAGEPNLNTTILTLCTILFLFRLLLGDHSVEMLSAIVPSSNWVYSCIVAVSFLVYLWYVVSNVFCMFFHCFLVCFAVVFWYLSQ